MAIKKVRMKPPGYTDIVHPETSADVVIEDASHRFVTDSEKGIWNAKQAAITGGATTITSSNLTASRALVSDASGKVTVSAVTSTQLGYLSGATGNIQTQMNLKLERNNDVGSGVGVGTLTIADANLLQGFPASTFARQSDLASANTKIGLGGIVESGSNANGSYVKFGNGTLISLHRLVLSVNSNAGGTITWTYPIQYSSPPASQLTAYYDIDSTTTAGSISNGFYNVPDINTNTSYITCWVRNNSSTNNITAILMLTAIGRWK